jgi:hypothetical protein
MTLDEKLDEALKGTFPASDAFYIAAEMTASIANHQVDAHPVLGPVEDRLDP